MTTRQYEKQAADFLKSTKSTLAIEFYKKDKYFADDTQYRNIYDVTIRKGNERYKFTFGDSVMNTNEGKKPTAYDILACLTKYDVGSFEDFCSEFGYDFDSKKEEKKALKLYNAMCKEYEGISKLYNDDEMEKLREIQ